MDRTLTRSTTSRLITISMFEELSWALVRYSRRWSSSSGFLRMRIFCKGFFDVGLHHSLRSYFVRGEVTSLIDDRGVDHELAKETLAPNAFKVDRLR
ncbi:uncharacterized protein A4U43_C01F14650 [Asparagus officinalis]|uniref:Uncharacterized protein n=1 Tax=Asparagus officinalis TaxID=4686 RepID=A0A5P1FT35_ASPOF|nr:uncharacterized protein A4U43_C01F14650 [Asparagus officinalis]